MRNVKTPNVTVQTATQGTLCTRLHHNSIPSPQSQANHDSSMVPNIVR